MTRICPSCEKETPIETVEGQETINVRGEKVRMRVEFYRCKTCGSEFENTRGPDALESAYRTYRVRHGMLQPEAIRDWRKSHGLTQRELNALLGWGGATLSRYENGALQDDAHEKIMRLAMEPHNLLKLIRDTREALEESKRSRLINDLSAADAKACSLQRILEEPAAAYAADVLTGYRKLDVHKMSNAILFFCANGQFETKLNKLLFYADFKHFKQFTVGITGARYVHLPYGPVPDGYDLFIADLVGRNELGIEEVFFETHSGKQCRSARKPDLKLFSESEVRILEFVRTTFAQFAAKKISDFSHEERGYLETRKGEPISYRYAESLKI